MLDREVVVEEEVEVVVAHQTILQNKDRDHRHNAVVVEAVHVAADVVVEQEDVAEAEEVQ